MVCCCFKGSHPGNVWPIMVGYVAASFATKGLCAALGTDFTTAINAQAIVIGLCFANGLSPVAGKYGWWAGIVFGVQFEAVAYEEKCRRFLQLRDEFCAATGIDEQLFVLVDEFSQQDGVTQFNLHERSYRPIRSAEEYQFIKFMLYDKAKWLPALAA